MGLIFIDNILRFYFYKLKYIYDMICGRKVYMSDDIKCKMTMISYSLITSLGKKLLIIIFYLNYKLISMALRFLTKIYINNKYAALIE